MGKSKTITINETILAIADQPKKASCQKSNATVPDTDTIIPDKNFAELNSYICIPVGIDKKPIVSWKNITETPKHLFKKEHNIAIITGKINGLTIIDIDIPKPGKDELDGIKMMADLVNMHNGGKPIRTPTCRTQSGGLHYYFKYDADLKTTTGVNGYSIDIRNDSGIIVAPPSIGEKGPYQWINNLSLSNVEPIVIPQWLKEWLKLEETKKKEKVTNKGKTKSDTQSYPINKEYVYIYDTVDIINLLNKLPIKYLNNYQSWFIITSCLKSEGLYDLWTNWSSKSKKYDEEKNLKQWNSFVPKVNITYLVVLAKKENIDIEPNIIKTTKKIKFLTAKPDIQINKQYVEKDDIKIDDKREDLMHVNSTIVCSGCGTGKTTFSCAHINDTLKSGNYRFLSPTVRVSLAYQQVANFSKNKLAVSNYKNIIKSYELNKQKNLVIQVDSLIKLNPNSWNNTIVYLDEISCLISYILTSSTLNQKRMNVFNTLCEFLVKASKILITDADVNDMVLTFLNKLGIKYYLVENLYKNPIKIKANEYKSKELLLKKIEQQFLDNDPAIFCFDSKKEMDMVVERMKKFCEDNGLTKQLNNFLIYSSTDGDENDFFYVTSRWKGKFVFMTPKITIGLSYDGKMPRNVYLIGLGNSINAIAFIQQIARCRNMKELFYYVVNKYQYLKYNSVDDVKTYYKEIIGDYNNLCFANAVNATTAKSNKKIKDHDTDNDDLHLEKSDYDKLKIIIDTGNATKDFTKDGNWNLSESLFNELFYYNEYYDNILRSAPREQFRWLLEGKNFEIVYNTEEVKDADKKVIAENAKNAKERIDLNNEQLCQRALYNRVSSLTVVEKKIRDDAERRAKFLNIDFGKKLQKKKWEKFLISDVEFTRHIAYRLLVGDETKLNAKIASSLEKDYKITICNSLEVKVKLIKQIEKILGVETLDIDTQRDMNRFDEDVDIDDGLLKTLKKTFRIGKADNKMLKSFEYFYYQLIQLYKNVLGNEICIYKLIMINSVHHKKYIINTNVLNEHINLNK